MNQDTSDSLKQVVKCNNQIAKLITSVILNFYKIDSLLQKAFIFHGISAKFVKYLNLKTKKKHKNNKKKSPSPSFNFNKSFQLLLPTKVNIC